MGDFEFALVFYHRGHKLRPELEEFRLGIQKVRQIPLVDHLTPLSKLASHSSSFYTIVNGIQDSCMPNVYVITDFAMSIFQYEGS